MRKRISLLVLLLVCSVGVQLGPFSCGDQVISEEQVHVHLVHNTTYTPKLPDLFQEDQVLQHIHNSIHSMHWLPDNGRQTLFCVDDRSPNAIVAVPGGDMAEFAAAVYVFFRDFRNTTEAGIEEVRKLFVEFVDKEINANRPFYFHTDSEKLRMALARISERVGRRVTILPKSAPPEREIGVWLEELSRPDAQGCGHLNKLMSNPNAYGMTSNLIVRNLIKVFYEQFWKAHSDPEAKIKFLFDVKLGTHEGKAVAIVNSHCEGFSPAIPSFSLVNHPMLRKTNPHKRKATIMETITRKKICNPQQQQ